MKYFIPISKQDILKYFSFPSVFFVQRKPNYIDLILQRARVTTELNIILSTFLKSVLTINLSSFSGRSSYERFK